jgi:hypothetical protein
MIETKPAEVWTHREAVLAGLGRRCFLEVGSRTNVDKFGGDEGDSSTAALMPKLRRACERENTGLDTGDIFVAGFPTPDGDRLRLLSAKFTGGPGTYERLVAHLERSLREFFTNEQEAAEDPSEAR